MVVACFASHIHRVQQIIDVAKEQNRKIALMGRSMEANVKLARKLHLLHVDAADFIDVENIDRYAPGEVCVICTGSQGEPLAALSKFSRGDARFMKVGRRRHGDPRARTRSRATSGPSGASSTTCTAPRPRSSTRVTSRCTPRVTLARASCARSIS